MATRDQKIIEINDHGHETYRSTWGYHPCNYETFLKIKKLYKAYRASQRKAKAWFRWARKMEHNRKGQEPGLLPVFNELIPSKGPCSRAGERTIHSSWLKIGVEGKGNAYMYDMPIGYEPEEVKASWGTYIRQKSKGPNHKNAVVVRSHGIEEAYKQARIPVENPNDVRPLKIPIGQIDAMMSDLSDWLDRN